MFLCKLNKNVLIKLTKGYLRSKIQKDYNMRNGLHGDQAPV